MSVSISTFPAGKAATWKPEIARDFRGLNRFRPFPFPGLTETAHPIEIMKISGFPALAPYGGIRFPENRLPWGSGPRRRKSPSDFGKNRTEAGMGGIGSGRIAGFGRTCVEEVKALDINRLNRAGCLKPGISAITSWTRNGIADGSVRHVARADGLVLSYSWRAYDDPPEAVCAFVPIIWTPCNFGGQRPWFACPRCGRKVAKLYGVGRRFLCRHCHRLPHASQSEDEIGRSFRRADRIRRRIDPDSSRGDFPRRPKGMWRRTWDRLLAELIAAEDAAEAGFLAKAAWFRGEAIKRDAGR